ncbi:hypothetical protein E2562_012851 [Oryza meyeriana var. granulata]|uniref:Uncharacterized protein n=1 Tax=Oryza meyeriana var. granulata TaxID=110450 RepID=A0A6G1CPP5_9ORYZ|nr:hypothetical protein E2562_012851 [Oryza meyeriana var. granulata]
MAGQGRETETATDGPGDRRKRTDNGVTMTTPTSRGEGKDGGVGELTSGGGGRHGEGDSLRRLGTRRRRG